MRLLAVLILIVIINFSFGQDINVANLAADEGIFRKLIMSRLLEKDYDPIEGIWNMRRKTLIYLNGQLENSQSANLKVGIIKINNTISVFIINVGKTGDFLEKDARDSYYTFHRTERDAYGIARFFPGEGRLVGFDKFVAVNKMTDDHLRRNFPSAYRSYNIESYEEKELIRIYPTQQDIQDAASEIQRKEREEAPRSGTGFLISNDGLVVTNYHVISNAKIIKARGINSDFDHSYSLKVIQEDISNDLAILKIEDPLVKINSPVPFVINSKQADVGEDIFVLGYPLTATMGEEIKLTTGIISSKTGFKGEISEYQISAPIQPGNSGGPVFDRKGNLIGVVNAKHLNTENVGYSKKALYLLNMIGVLSRKIPSPSNSILANKSLTEQVNLLKKFVFIIEVNQ